MHHRITMYYAMLIIVFSAILGTSLGATLGGNDVICPVGGR